MQYEGGNVQFEERAITLQNTYVQIIKSFFHYTMKHLYELTYIIYKQSYRQK